MSTLTPSSASVVIGSSPTWELIINGLGTTANWSTNTGAFGHILSAGTHTLGIGPLGTDTTMTVIVYNSDGSHTDLSSTITIAASGGAGYFEPLYDFVAPTTGTNNKRLYAPGFFNTSTGVYGLGTYPIAYSYMNGSGQIPYFIGYNVTGGTSPVITANISGTSTVTVGNSLVLTVTVTGTTPMTFTWWKNGSSIGTVGVTDGSGLSNTLTQTNRQLTDDGATYYCVITNSYGTATTGTVTLSVPASTKIWPNASTLSSGSGIATNPTYSYDEQALSVATGAEVTSYVTNAHFAFSNGTSGVMTINHGDPDEIVYNPTYDYLVFDFPAGTIDSPTLTLVYDTALECPVTDYVSGGAGTGSLPTGSYGGKASLALEVSTTTGVWVPIDTLDSLLLGGFSSGGSSTVSKTISISNLTGTINTSTAKVRIKAYTDTLTIYSWPEFTGLPVTIFPGTVTANINIYALYLSGTNAGFAPVITSNISGTSSLAVGASLDLTVAASGTEPLTFTWHRSASANYVTGPSTSHSSNLVETNKQIADTGNTYYCVASNAHGTATSGTVTLDVTTSGTLGFRPSAGTGVSNFPNVLTPNIDSVTVDTTTFSNKVSPAFPASYTFDTFGTGTRTGTLRVRGEGTTETNTDVNENVASSQLLITYTCNVGSGTLLDVSGGTTFTLSTLTTATLTSIDLSTLSVTVEVNGERTLGLVYERISSAASLDLYDIVFLTA